MQGDPQPFRRLLPAGPKRPILVEIPHASTTLIPEVENLRALTDHQIRRDADLFVDALWDFAPCAGATVVVATQSRYVVDLNRAEDDADSLSVEGFSGDARPRGVIWRVDTDGHPTLNAPLPRALFDQLIESTWRPYHHRIGNELGAIALEHGFAILVAAHSMPSVGRAAHTDPGTDRADVVLGDRHGLSCDPRVTEWAKNHFERAGLSIALNDPYAGGFSTGRYGRPGDGIHALQIELSRALYMDEATLTFHPRDARHISRILEHLIESAPALD
ncbi:MAG: N-formylglutamate amidohydrolase [Deltaproteobacteria bacterium]|nr:N-formylglutamate amidohydrolase [Deltaproteobacteria bacterium]